MKTARAKARKYATKTATRYVGHNPIESREVVDPDMYDAYLSGFEAGVRASLELVSKDCFCDPAYFLRGRTDPSCEFCSVTKHILALLEEKEG